MHAQIGQTPNTDGRVMYDELLKVEWAELIQTWFVFGTVAVLTLVAGTITLMICDMNIQHTAAGRSRASGRQR
jgi:hypothetical protein